MINTEKRTHSITVHNCYQTHLTLLILDPSFVGRCVLKDEPITLCLTDFYFHRTVCQQKNIRRNLTVSQYFRLVIKMGLKPGTTLVIVKFLISYLRCLLFVIFRRIKCNKEQQVINCWFCSLADSLLKFSTEIYFFIKHLKNCNLLYFSIDIPVQCCP